MQNLTAGPRIPLPKASQIPCAEPQDALPTLTPCLIVAASRAPSPNSFLRSRLFPSSCSGDRRALGSCLSPEIRQRWAAGQGSCVAFVWDPKENNRSYFRLYGSGESPRPSAGSKGTAAGQGLDDPLGSSLGMGLGDPFPSGLPGMQHDGTWMLGMKDGAAWGFRAVMSC